MIYEGLYAKAEGDIEGEAVDGDGGWDVGVCVVDHGDGPGGGEPYDPEADVVVQTGELPAGVGELGELGHMESITAHVLRTDATRC